jgi:hypothetical protein
MTLCDAPIRDNSPAYCALSIALAVISGIFVLQRFFFKMYAKIDLGVDDWLTLATLGLNIPITTIAILPLVSNGMGRDIWTLQSEQIYTFGKLFFLNGVLYFAEITLLKLALLFFYLRIFPHRRVRLVIWYTVAFNSVTGIMFVLVTAFLQCRPISSFWTLWDGMHAGKCLDRNALAWANATISIALDIWMLILPLSQLKKLQLSWKKKLGVSAMFSVGFL